MARSSPHSRRRRLGAPTRASHQATSYRSSVERLIKRVLAAARCPEVNALVDLYNAVSLDANSARCRRSRHTRAISLPLSRAPTTLHRHGRRDGRGPNDPPKVGESSTPTPVTCCAGAGTGARTRAAPSLQTRRVALTAQSNGAAMSKPRGAPRRADRTRMRARPSAALSSATASDPIVASEPPFPLLIVRYALLILRFLRRGGGHFPSSSVLRNKQTR